MAPTRTFETEVYASHHQFYIVDPGGESHTDLVWDGGGLERRLGVASGIVAVGTVGYCTVPVCIELWEKEPELDLDGWDHVVDASFEVRSGRIALAGVEGPAELDPIDLDRGSYRLRSSVRGLDGADELDGGDEYRTQVWPAEPAEPAVRKWWGPWRPSVEPRRTTGSGRVLLGAEAHDRRPQMRWLAARGETHLFEDADGLLWEHSSLRDASGTPQLEELDEGEAVRRFGARDTWGPKLLEMPSLGTTLRNVAQTLRYHRGWRPDPSAVEPPVVRGPAVFLRTSEMTAVASEGEDALYRDDDRRYWELSGESITRDLPTLTLLTAQQVQSKYGRVN